MLAVFVNAWGCHGIFSRTGLLGLLSEGFEGSWPGLVIYLGALAQPRNWGCANEGTRTPSLNAQKSKVCSRWCCSRRPSRSRPIRGGGSGGGGSVRGAGADGGRWLLVALLMEAAVAAVEVAVAVVAGDGGGATAAGEQWRCTSFVRRKGYHPHRAEGVKLFTPRNGDQHLQIIDASCSQLKLAHQTCSNITPNPQYTIVVSILFAIILM